jgi:site-specific recombinase XerD
MPKPSAKRTVPENETSKSTPRRGQWIDHDRAVAHSPAAAYLTSIGAGSRRTMQQSLVSIAALLAGEGADPIKVRWECLRREETRRLREQLAASHAPATANKMLSALRGVLRAARRMDLMSEGQFQTAASLEMIKPAPTRLHCRVNDASVAALFAACEKEAGAAGRRDAALLAIFLSSGLRRSEARELDVGDFAPRSGVLHIRGTGPEFDRLVTLTPPARRAVADWLEVRTHAPGPLLLPVDRGGIVRFRRLTDQAVYDIIGRVCERAGLAALNQRDLRRAYVLSLIRSGRTAIEVQELAGHASWLTTATYERMASDRESETYDLSNLPYRSRKGADRG